MIAPSLAFIIGFKTDCVMLKAPVRFTLSTFSKSASVILSIRVSWVIPALLTKTSTEPSSAIACSTMRLASAKSDTSPEMGTTLTP